LNHATYFYKYYSMETSLIGKALDFGSNDWGFESPVSKLSINYTLNYTLNHISINTLGKNLSFKIYYTQKILKILKILKNLGVIRRFYLLKTNKNKTLVRVYPFYYKNRITYGFLKIFSTPSKSFFISYRALRYLNKCSGGSHYLIETNEGIVTHKIAIKKKLGGKFFALITN
jgi:ribosomal protein S8